MADSTYRDDLDGHMANQGKPRKDFQPKAITSPLTPPSLHNNNNNKPTNQLLVLGSSFDLDQVAQDLYWLHTTGSSH
ncbi:hypothetical protein M8J75_009426 [Diaphorina citri]|nr:hypothetical protein M8J75_009525 [Diaphorina citri]KAI5712565.1 hypothetical protein M8J75_009426 [Diaphorina citri]